MGIPKNIKYVLGTKQLGRRMASVTPQVAGGHASRLGREFDRAIRDRVSRSLWQGSGRLRAKLPAYRLETRRYLSKRCDRVKKRQPLFVLPLEDHQRVAPTLTRIAIATPVRDNRARLGYSLLTDC